GRARRRFEFACPRIQLRPWLAGVAGNLPGRRVPAKRCCAFPSCVACHEPDPGAGEHVWRKRGGDLVSLQRFVAAFSLACLCAGQGAARAPGAANATLYLAHEGGRWCAYSRKSAWSAAVSRAQASEVGEWGLIRSRGKCGSPKAMFG